MTTPNKNGAFVMFGSGQQRISSDGKFVLYDEKSTCSCCCFPFTVSPADALAQVGSSTRNYRSESEIMNALKDNGRHVFKLKKGKYSVRYKSGYFVMGCGRINCAHYHGYLVTSFGALPGIVGGWGDSCCEGPDGYGYNYDREQTLQALEDLKKEKPTVHVVDEDDFIFKTGYYPWWSQSYVGGAMTFELCVVTGGVKVL